MTEVQRRLSEIIAAPEILRYALNMMLEQSCHHEQK